MEQTILRCYCAFTILPGLTIYLQSYLKNRSFSGNLNGKIRFQCLEPAKCQSGRGMDMNTL